MNPNPKPKPKPKPKTKLQLRDVAAASAEIWLLSALVGRKGRSWLGERL